ncbi:MAG: sigma-70 family RNA polymerase sigma factor [Oscillospiraceae bacterium]|jgi:RNA polymerase sigma factor (sigma-70 family)|nr:sigma-70 family RNA polymerase sigma factor [Oscillospiraceae bacterium]
MNPTEFEALFAEQATTLRRFCNFKLPGKADGEDVFQETALAAFRHREEIRSAESFKPWLLRIAANKCNDFYRRRAKLLEIPLDALENELPAQSRYGLAAQEAVQDTLALLGTQEQQILWLYYFKNKPQADIATQLRIPIGTVKSRLHNAKRRFKEAYPYPPPTKGETQMSNAKQLPETLPPYTITPSALPPFPVKWEETMGWFFIPRPGETLRWAIYDSPGGTRSECYDCRVIGAAAVHGIEGVEVEAVEHRGGAHEADWDCRDAKRTFIAQLTDTHCRILAESHSENGVRKCYTFLDGDAFLHNWGFGEDNCGNETDLRPKGDILRTGDVITAQQKPFLLDVVGRYTVEIGGKRYDTICVIDIETYNPGVVAEQFLDQNGRTVLWRRFNRDDWKLERYGQRWSERFPDHQQMQVNGALYVHWYDCITDYIL